MEIIEPKPLHNSTAEALGLALKDLWHDWNVSLCLVAAMAAVLAPLLILLGLKTGIISTMWNNLLSNPANLEIRFTGHSPLKQDWFDDLKDREDVQFVIPLTRSLSAQMDIRKDLRNFIEGILVLPTADGDPLMDGLRGRMPHAVNEVVLSYTAALDLGIEIGGDATAVITRRFEGSREIGRLRLVVTGIMPESSTSRKVVFTTLEFLVEIEDFRDEMQSPLLGVETGKPKTERELFSRARLYANDLNAVGTLADYVRSTAVNVETNAGDIRAVQGLGRVFDFVFSVIAWAAGLGAVAALAGAFLANNDRKRKDLALMRLIGFSRRSIAFFPSIQAVMIASVAFFIAICIYIVGAGIFQAALADALDEHELLTHLPFTHGVIAYVITVFVALAAGAFGGYRAALVDPGDCLRES